MNNFSLREGSISAVFDAFIPLNLDIQTIDPAPDLYLTVPEEKGAVAPIIVSGQSSAILHLALQNASESSGLSLMLEYLNNPEGTEPAVTEQQIFDSNFPFIILGISIVFLILGLIIQKFRARGV